MGRHKKQIQLTEGIDRRELGYYSTPMFVAHFFAKRIRELRPHARFVLDPCIGRGELTLPLKASGFHVSGYDVVDMGTQGCDEFFQRDFLKVAMEDALPSLLTTARNKKIDVIVANPPYNCHEVDYIRENKTELTSKFGKSATLNMYALFMRAIFEYAPDNCLIGLVTHDSFLTANGHQELRRHILDTCVIHNLHLCPTSLFRSQGADVRTCLLILEKSKSTSGKIKISNRPASVEEFQEILEREIFEEYTLGQLLLGDERDNAEYTVGVPPEIAKLFSGKRLSDIAPCVTGISTGNDKQYIRSEQCRGFSVPFYKNPATRNFFAEPDGYLCDNYEEVGRAVSNFMIRNKDLIFRGGISCSSMGVKFGAALRPARTACGVNANIIIEDERKWWLLSFLNSRLCLYLARGIINRGNMITAGYAARIPIPEFSQDVLRELTKLGEAGFEEAKRGSAINKIKCRVDQFVEEGLKLSDKTRSLLQSFELDPTRLA